MSESIIVGLMAGDGLWSSCQADLYGTITKVHDHETVDIEVFDVEDILPEGCELVDDGWLTPHGRHVPMRVRVPDVHVKHIELDHSFREGPCPCLWGDESRAIGYSFAGMLVELDTPGDGCYRCTKLFSVVRKVEA